MHRWISRGLIAVCLTVTCEAKLIAHYDFTDGDLLDNEVSKVDYVLQNKSAAPGAMSSVWLNQAEGVAVFPGGVDSLVWLECKGPGELKEATVSFWFKTDQVHQQSNHLGLFAAGKWNELDSWHLQKAGFSDGGLHLSPAVHGHRSDKFADVYAANKWQHVVIRQETAGKLHVYITPESGSVGKPAIIIDNPTWHLDDIVFGSEASRRRGYRMEMANIKVYDSTDVSIDKLFKEGPGVRNPRDAGMWDTSDTLMRLKADAETTRLALSKLPSLEGGMQLNAYGCHSSYLPALDKLPDQARWTINLKGSAAVIREIYLIPAADRRSPTMPGYGFPKRFQITGTLINGETRVVADWRDHDFPDPGRLPARITIKHGKYSEIKIEVYRGQVEGNQEFFALDEVMVRGDFYLGKFKLATISSGFEAPPFWRTDYLIDGKTSFGLPVLPEDASSDRPNLPVSDCVVNFPTSPLVIEIDLKENKGRDDLVLYPAQPPEGLVVPGYGFPGSVNVEFFREAANSKKRFSIDNLTQQIRNPGNNVIRIHCAGKGARWARLTFNNFPEYKSNSVFALSEIEITKDRQSISAGCRVTSESNLPDSELKKLTDGHAAGRRVIPILQWLDALCLRRDLELRLEQNQATQLLLIKRKDRNQKYAIISGISILIVALVAFSLASYVMRRRQSHRLRQRITQDLHDDIGSKIGAISLASTFLRKVVPDPQAQESGRDIEEIAIDMKKALGEVLWFTNSKTDRLREIVHKLKGIAEYSVPAEMLTMVNTPIREVPDHSISVETKRDLMLLFKEALHNAAKHADASKLKVSILWNRPYLLLEIKDDGVGFKIEDDRNPIDCLGLDGMKRRADRLHATLNIDSAPNQGTTVRLKVKIGRI